MIRRFIQLFIFLIIQIAMIGSLSAESNLSASRDSTAQNFEFLSPITSFLLGDDQGLANTIQNCDADYISCLLYTSPSPRDLSTSRMPSSA